MNWPALWQQAADTSLAVIVREHAWVYPALETIHLVGLALIVGSIMAFDLRVLGFHRGLSLPALGRHLLPWVWGGFAANAVSGLLMFLSDAGDFAANPAFQAKLALIAVAGLNAAAFRVRFSPMHDEIVGTDMQPSAAAKVSAALSIALWLAIVTAGRLIAYLA